jgi:hypothetical protein
MGILQITTDTTGQINVNPRRVKIITTDNLATVTAAGYLRSANLEGYTIYNTDIIDMWYGAIGSGTAIISPGTFETFIPSIINGVITLVATVNPGDVLLPVVSGDYAIFNGTTGQIKDSSQAPTNAASPFVVTSPGAVTINHVAQFADVNGTLKDGGVLGTAAAKAASDNTKATVASVSGATVLGNLLKAGDTAGTVADAGFALHAGTTAAYAGGGTSNTFTTTNMTASSIVTAVILASTNSVSITKALPGTNTLAVTFSADPGAGTTVSWISVTPAG